VRRTKVALDANIPQRLVRMLESGFGAQGFEFIWEPDFAAGDDDDDVWAAAFRRFGGRLVITGDKNMARRPHQILAFKESGLVGFFFERKWAEFDLTFRAAHMIMWWPRIQVKFADSNPGDCWWVPAMLREHPFTKAELPAHEQTEPRRQEKPA
jgi:hypothetical protein